MKSTNRYAPSLEIVTRTLTASGRLGKQVARILQTHDHRRAVSILINPNGYRDWRDFARDYAAVSLVKKLPFLTLPGIDPRAVALKKFRDSESRCHQTNIMFCRPSTIPHEQRVLLSAARKEVKRILGKFSWDMVLPFLSHGPGATYGTRKDRGHPWYKFGEKEPTVTGDCLALHSVFSRWSVLWDCNHSENTYHPKVVCGSKVTTVPKDARQDRTIAIEPLLNMFYQKGIGGLMRSRLRRSGCNLNDQSINQGLALEGSLSNRLATIDLSSASDTVSRGLVDYLLPSDWLAALNLTRSHWAELGGEKIFLQKFSSMGNGFTFELESLIFLALGRAVSPGKESVVSVYGDDIIVESDKVTALVRLLHVCGFSTNSEKSYWDGPFRESCGKHYFLGHDVTPFYLKAEVNTQERYLWYLNSLKRLAYRFIGMQYGCCESLRPAYEFLYAKLDPKYRALSVPEGFGDGGVLRDFDDVTPRPKARKNFVEGYVTQHVVRRYASLQPHGWPELLRSLFSLGILPKSERELHNQQPKDRAPSGIPLTKFKSPVVRLEVTRWVDLGPWVSLS